MEIDSRIDVDYKVPGANCTLRDLCGFFKQFVNLTDGSEWKVHQGMSPTGGAVLSKEEQAQFMLKHEPTFGELYYIMEDKVGGRETLIAYTSFKDNAIGLIFIRNNVMKLVRGCLQAMGDLGKARRRLAKMKERAKDNDMISMTEHRAIVKTLQDRVDELSRKS